MTKRKQESVKPMFRTLITVIDQNDSKFGDSTLEGAIVRAESYAKPGDVFRVYVYDNDQNPYPGYIAAWVTADSSGTITTLRK